MMRSLIRPFLALLLWAAVQQAVAHPGSGIVADRAGNIYFVDTGSGVWKVDPEVRLTRIPGPAFHWMAIDEGNSLAHVTLPYFSRGDATVTRAGTDPSLLLSSDFPLVVGRDTSLYYPWLDDEGGRLKIFRLDRSGAELVPSLSTGQIDLAATSPGANFLTDVADEPVEFTGTVTAIVELNGTISVQVLEVSDYVVYLVHVPAGFDFGSVDLLDTVDVVGTLDANS